MISDDNDVDDVTTNFDDVEAAIARLTTTMTMNGVDVDDVDNKGDVLNNKFQNKISAAYTWPEILRTNTNFIRTAAQHKIENSISILKFTRARKSNHDSINKGNTVHRHKP